MTEMDIAAGAQSDQERIAAFFDAPAPWRGELAAFRALLQESPLLETFKWHSPCYTLRGGNVATLWRLKEACGLSFFKGVLLGDPEGLLGAPGPHSQAVRLMRVTDRQEIARHASYLRALIAEAVANEETGRRVSFGKEELDYPEELIERLDLELELAEAFAALTPGRRRGYLIAFAQPKGAEARIRRIDKAAPRILDGKGLHDR